MKKILWLLVFIVWPIRPAFAMANNTYLSSNTFTQDTAQLLCVQYAVNGTTNTQRGILHEVAVSSPTPGSYITFFNSTFTVVGSSWIGPINASNATNQTGFIPYDVIFPQGMMYSKVGLSTIQILYACY